MSALESNLKPDKLFKQCLIMLVLSGINNFLNKLNLLVKPAETFDMVRCFAEIHRGRMRWNCGNILRKKTRTFHYGSDVNFHGDVKNTCATPRFTPFTLQV